MKEEYNVMDRLSVNNKIIDEIRYSISTSK